MNKLTPNLMVEDVDKTVDWYKDILSAEVYDTVPYEKDNSISQFAIIGLGGVEIMFQKRDSLEGEIPYLKGVPISASLTLYIDMSWVDRFYEQIKDKVDVVQEMHETFYETKEFAIKDINGYVLAFAQSIKNIQR